MQASTRDGQRNVITISSSPSQLKKPQIIWNVCALLNSGGGDLVITFCNQIYQRRDLDQPTKVIEQWIETLIGNVVMTEKVELKVSSHQIVLNVKASRSLVTVDYNMFLPGHTQVKRILSTESLEKIQHLLFGNKQMSTNNELPIVQQTFVQGEEIKLIETYSVQFKQLEDAPSKSKTLGDRIVDKGNKLIQCLSAFANHRGGVIYVGVDDKLHLINGEKVSPREMESIKKKVKNKIEKMIWLGLENGPQQGKNWDIYFRQIIDKEGKPVESTFIIAIVVAHCRGGVFLQEPECYHLVHGYVKKMELHIWKKYLISTHMHDDQDAVHSSISESSSALQIQCYRSQWSSDQNRIRYDHVNGVLIRMINDGSWDDFKARAEKVLENCVLGGIRLVVLLMKITTSYKKRNFKEAEEGIEEYKRRLGESEDRFISETREFLLRSSLERCKGNIEESYKQAENGLSIAEQIPPGIVAGEYYANIATVITILLGMENDTENKTCLKEKAMLFFEKADQHLDLANDYLPSKFDQKQKVHINLAFLHLGCSFVINPKPESRVEDTAIKKATNSLNAVDKYVNEGYALSDYRNSQYLLARSVLFYRLSQNLKDDELEKRTRLLHSALKFSKSAKRMARDGEFDEMLNCTSQHIDFFTRLENNSAIEDI